MIITIDGPSASGKSTVAKALARRLGFHYLDTGAFYRAFTWKVIKVGVDPKDENALYRLVKETQIEVQNSHTGIKVLVDGRDVTEEIRDPQVTEKVHYVASKARIRKHLVELQRQTAAGTDVVAEGRDTGTVVFPKADRKFYLDAQPEERAKRRRAELGGKKTTYEKVLEDLRLRDQRDSTRQASPLRRGPDFICVDTTKLTVEEVVDALLKRL